MLVTALGTSTSYGYWGFKVVARVLEAVQGEALRIHCLDLEQLHSQWDERKARPVLLTSDRPDTALAVMLSTSGCPLVAFFDSAFDAMAHSVVNDGRTAMEAARFCSQYISALAACLSSSKVVVFGTERLHSEVRDLVADVALAIGASLDGDLLDGIVEHLAPAERLGPRPTVEAVLREERGGETLKEAAARLLTPTDRELLSRAAASYSPLLEGRGWGALDWPRELFYFDAKGGGSDGDVQMIGAARHIYWGPYLHLPIGRWRAAIQFEVLDNTSGNEIEGDVCVGTVQIAKATARLPERGYFQFELEFANKDPNLPIEVRICILKGAIEGRFGLRQVTVEPVASLTGPRREDAAPAAQTQLGDPNAAHA